MAKARQMTLPETAQLEGLIAAARQGNPGRNIWLLLAAATLAPAIFTMLAYLLLAILAMLIGIPLANGAWRSNPITFYIALAVPILIWGYTVSSQIRWTMRSKRAQRQRLAELEADLAGGQVRDETFTVTAVKRLRDPEHGMLMLFLRLSNDKIFVLYDYGSAETGAEGPAQPKLTPATTFHLLTFPVSKARSWSFSGDPLPLPTPLELTSDDWPDDESWCKVSWDRIEEHFAGKVL
jgi:membrane protein implicated in regulation of membrane protease activity